MGSCASSICGYALVNPGQSDTIAIEMPSPTFGDCIPQRLLSVARAGKNTATLAGVLVHSSETAQLNGVVGTQLSDTQYEFRHAVRLGTCFYDLIVDITDSQELMSLAESASSTDSTRTAISQALYIEQVYQQNNLSIIEEMESSGEFKFIGSMSWRTCTTNPIMEA